MPPSDSEASNSGPGRPSKVPRLVEKYDLTTLGEDLERRWTAPDDERYSLRELAAYANQQVLRRVMVEAGLSPLDGEVENLYRLLTSDGVSRGSRIQAERRLERHGIDVDALRTDFVSYQAVRRYLTNERNAEYTTDERDQLEAEAQGLQRLMGRTETIARNKLERMQDTDRLTLGEFTVSAPIRVFCKDCGKRFDIVKLLSQGSCECAGDSSASAPP